MGILAVVKIVKGSRPLLLACYLRYNTKMEDEETFTYAVIGGGIAGVTCAEHLYILDPDARTVLITASGLIKAVTNILPITKTLDMFDVEERSSEQLESECPNVTV